MIADAVDEECRQYKYVGNKDYAVYSGRGEDRKEDV